MEYLAQEIVDAVFAGAPDLPWSSDSRFLFGSGQTEVTQIGVAWRLTGPMLRDLATRGAQLAMTHEPVLYDMPRQYRLGQVLPTDQLPANRCLRELIESSGMAIHRFGANLDWADDGMVCCLLERLGWQGDPVDRSRGIPVIQHAATPLGELIEQVKHRLGVPFVRYHGRLDQQVGRIALNWGTMAQWWVAAACAEPAGFDLLLAGDVSDSVVRLARERGWAVVDVMPHALAGPMMHALARRLHERFGRLTVCYYENALPWQVG